MEVSSVDGHIVNTDTHEFVIEDSHLERPEVVVIETTHINYKGSVVVTKVDALGEELEGAVFEVRDASGNLVAVDIAIDGGVYTITNIPVGEFKLVEISAPTGYILNTTGITFEIEDNQAGEPELIDLGEYVNYKGSVLLVKISEAGLPLMGVEFELLNADKEVVMTDLFSDENGYVFVEDLSVGTYYFREVASIRWLHLEYRVSRV